MNKRLNKLINMRVAAPKKVHNCKNKNSLQCLLTYMFIDFFLI